MPKSPIPILYVHLNDLITMVYFNAKNMPEFARDVIGINLAKITNKMLEKYLEYTNGLIDKETAMESIIKGTTYLKNQMKIIQTLHLISNAKICRLLETVVTIERLSRKYYNIEIQRRQNAKK